MQTGLKIAALRDVVVERVSESAKMCITACLHFVETNTHIFIAFLRVYCDMIRRDATKPARRRRGVGNHRHAATTPIRILGGEMWCEAFVNYYLRKMRFLQAMCFSVRIRMSSNRLTLMCTPC